MVPSKPLAGVAGVAGAKAAVAGVAAKTMIREVKPVVDRREEVAAPREAMGAEAASSMTAES